MSKTLANMVTETRMILDEVSDADWTDSQIITECSYAYLEMYTAVVETYEDYYRTVSTTALIATQQEYELPSDIYKIRRIEVKYDAAGDYIKSKPFSFDQIGTGYDTTLYTATSRPIYDLSGSYIRLLPIPSVSVTEGLRLIYIAAASPLVDPTDVINLPFVDRYATYIPLGACGKLLKKGQQEETVARGYNEEFQVGMEKMKNELENRYADGVKMIQDTQQQHTDFSRP